MSDVQELNAELARMQGEVARLAQYIENAKREIFAISANDKPDSGLNDASLHLDAVIKATEEASHTIMDAADVIQAASSGTPKEQEIMDATTRIYEACNFQDISGQRLTKVIRLLNSVEERVNKLNQLFGANAAPAAALKNSVVSDADLLNGPQLPAQGTTQADIDALFSNGN